MHRHHHHRHDTDNYWKRALQANATKKKLASNMMYGIDAHSKSHSHNNIFANEKVDGIDLHCMYSRSVYLGEKRNFLQMPVA